MTLSNWNPNYTIAPTSGTNLNPYLCIPFAGGSNSTPVTPPSSQIMLIVGSSNGANDYRLRYDGTWETFSIVGGLHIAQACWTGTQWCAVCITNDVYTSPDARTWTFITTLETGTMNYLGNNAATIAVILDADVVRISTTGGNTWDANEYTPFIGTAGVTLIHATVVGSRVFATCSSSGGPAYAYADIGSLPAPGTAWTIVALSGTGEPSNVLSQGGALYVGTSTGLYKSTNNGVSVSSVTTNLPADGVPIYYVYYSTVQSAFLVGRTSAPLMLESPDGATWTSLSTGLSTVSDGISDANTSAPATFATQRSAGVAQLSGSTWSIVQTPECFAIGMR